VKDAMALQKAIEWKHEGLKWPSSSSYNPLFPGGIVGSIFKSNDPPTPSSLPPLLSNQTIVVVLDWSKALDLDRIGDQVSFLLGEYRRLAMTTTTRGSPTNNNAVVERSHVPNLEVVLMLNSPGGSAADFGLAAQHLMRLKGTAGITLTICVDKVAASGGYMLCCTASPGQLFASPFAVVGSIGVIGQVINIQNLLEGWGIQPLVFKGGKDKAPLGLLGDVSDEGKRTTQAFVDATHKAFRDHVVKARPILKKEIDKIGNGDIYLGSQALAMKLIDGILTADEYLESKLQEGARVLKMIRNPRANFLFGPRYGSDSSFESKLLAPTWGVPCGVQNIVKKLSLDTLPATIRMPCSIQQLFSKRKYRRGIMDTIRSFAVAP
jgi:signal peptide peptidase SppA